MVVAEDQRLVFCRPQLGLDMDGRGLFALVCRCAPLDILDRAYEGRRIIRAYLLCQEKGSCWGVHRAHDIEYPTNFVTRYQYI
jgi:hypothetical protein